MKIQRPRNNFEWVTLYSIV